MRKRGEAKLPCGECSRIFLIDLRNFTLFEILARRGVQKIGFLRNHALSKSKSLAENPNLLCARILCKKQQNYKIDKEERN